MSDTRFTLAFLDVEHDHSMFNCGVPALNRYLQQQATQDIRNQVASVYVLLDNLELRVAGYFTLRVSNIEIPYLPENELRKIPGYPSVSACLVQRLAVDREYFGQGLGGRLFLDAFRRALEMSNQLGLIANRVDPIDVNAVGDDLSPDFLAYGEYSRPRLFLKIGHQWRLYPSLSELQAR